MDALLLFLVLGAIGAFYMGVSIGGNDAANSIATIIGSRSLPYRKAMLLGMCCEFLGGVLIASFVASTIRKGIADPSLWQSDYDRLELANGMLSTLLASGTFVTTCSLLGMPVSTTHAVVSGLVTFGLYTKGPASINKSQVRDIAVMWVASPVLGFLLTLVFWKAVLFTVHKTPMPRQAARRWLPVFIGLTLLVIVVFLMFSGLKALKLAYPLWLPFAVGVPLAVVAAVVSSCWLMPHLERLQRDADQRGDAEIVAPSRMPSWLARLGRWMDEDVIGALLGTKMTDAGLRKAAELQMDVLGPGGVSPAVTPPATPLLVPKGLTLVDEEQHSESSPEAVVVYTHAAPLETAETELEVTREDAEIIEAWSIYRREMSTLGDRSYGRAFAVLQMFTSGFVAFSHAANDVPNCIGPLGAIIALHGGSSVGSWTPPFYIALLGAVAFVVGIAVLGPFVNKTLGFKVSAMSPSSGWASDLAVASVMAFASVRGYPISSTHTVIGSITAIGFLNHGVRGVRWRLLAKIVIAKQSSVPESARLTTTSERSSSGQLVSARRRVETHEKTPEQPFKTARENTMRAPSARDPNETRSETITKKGDVRTKSMTYTTTMIGTTKKCAGCREMLGTAEYIICAEKNWHPQCFKCTACGGKANPHRYFLDKNKMPICEPCSRRPTTAKKQPH
eukprot:m51a1_g2474 hypothetical protein (677) ;mRNA; r:51242-53921